jgi:hypothetical protein
LFCQGVWGSFDDVVDPSEDIGEDALAILVVILISSDSQHNMFNLNPPPRPPIINPTKFDKPDGSFFFFFLRERERWVNFFIYTSI